MVDKTFKLSIITPQRIVYEGRVSSLIAPGENGYLGILADHAPFMSNLVPGKIVAKGTTGAPKAFYCDGGGVLEVLQNNVNILVCSMEK
jgi:F-type H+-transporting ATPase subunit epsilon